MSDTGGAPTPTGFLDKLLAPLRAIRDRELERRRREEAEVERRRQAYLREIEEDFAEAERFTPKSYRDLTPGEVRGGHTPAYEHLSTTGTVRLHMLLPPEQAERASLVQALARPLVEGSLDIYDVKPHEGRSNEHGAIILGPAEQFLGTHGTTWRLYIELSYSMAQIGGRATVNIRRYVLDMTI